jgi:hypothetical protein
MAQRYGEIMQRYQQEGFVKAYAQAILEDVSLEDLRLSAHDFASAALNLYVDRCHELGRTKLPSMYDDRSQQIMDDLMEAADRKFDEYFRKMYSKNLLLGVPIHENLFSKIVSLKQLTEDPMENASAIFEYLNKPKVVVESFQCSLIDPLNEDEYVPISNII